MGNLKESVAVARKYGALIEPQELSNLYAASFEQLPKDKITNFAEWSMKWLRLSNNSNRLITFMGHAEQVMDGVSTGVRDPKLLAKKTGLYWLDDQLRDRYVQEFLSSQPSQHQDIAYRAARDLTDISQWNYRRGAHPGLYKYGIGRLFGQYGTWPANYIEYARRLATKGEPSDRMQALTRLLAAHYGILWAGQQAGIDTAQWAFTQPTAYTGGPMYQAITNLPGTLDFETYKGADARRAVTQPIWPLSVPGGLFYEQIGQAVSEDRLDWRTILGFRALDEDTAHAEKGIHGFVSSLSPVRD